jgi:hypothetical protein
MDNLATDNPAEAVADNPMGPAAPNAGTGANGGQAPGAAPATDLFKGIDPNKLPPEIKAHYDSMLRDYREKTTKLSETTKAEIAKATEAYREKAERFDQVAGEEEFVRMWNEHVQKASAPAATENADPNDPVSKLENQLKEIQQKMQVSELAQVTDAFADAVDEKGEKLHPEFDRLNGIVVGQAQNGLKSEEYSFLRACIDLAPGKSPQERLTNGYKTAKATYDAIYEEGRKAGLGRLQAKLNNGSQPPTNVGNIASTTDKRPKTAREALELARKGIAVSR